MMKKLAGRLLTVAATLVIVLALAIGAFRLLVAQLPGYQEELQAWATDALGLALEFERLDARLGLRGPELTFHDASIGGSDSQEPFLSARRANIRVDTLALITERRLAVNRLTLEGPRLVLVRERDGTLRLQGTAVEAGARMQWGRHIPAEVEVVVRDSEVVYLDRAADSSWVFRGVTAALSRIGDRLLLEARARPPAALASRAELFAEARLAGATAEVEQWSVAGSVRGVDLAVLRRLLPDGQPWPSAGTGDVSVMLGWSGQLLAEAEVELALDDVLIPSLGGAPAAFERLGVSAAWRQRREGWSLDLNDIALTRAGRTWPRAGRARVASAWVQGELSAVSMRSDFVRLQDLTPALVLVPERYREVLGPWAALDPRGDISDIELEIERAGESWDYAVAARLSRLGANPIGEWPGIDGLSGELRADTRSGRARLDAKDVELAWPQLFREPIGASELSGVLVWRQGQDGLRLVSDDLVLANADGSTRSSLELSWPLDGSSPRLDLESSVSATDAAAVKRYLPVHTMPDGAVEWLDRAIVGGRVVGAEVTFFGRLRDFPFDSGEGQFQVVAEVEGGTLEFMEGWPRAEELDATVTFRNASFEARGDGRVLGNRGRDVRVAIADMREAVLTLDGTTQGPLEDVLAFLLGAPLIAEHVGPELGRLKVEAGTAAVDVELALPLGYPAAYQLNGGLDIEGGTLALEGFDQQASDITGRLIFGNASVTGEDLEAVLLDGPVTARLAIPGPAGYSAQIDLDGELGAHALVEAFNLPLGERVAGRAHWRGSVLVPARSAARALRINVASSLSGIALGFPAPFAKSPAEVANLRLDVAYAESRGLELRGALGASRRFALSFVDDGAGLDFRRGALRFGGAFPELPAGDGLTIQGQLPALSLDDWAAIARAPALDPSALSSLLLDARLDVGELSVLRQELGASRLLVNPAADEWRIDIDSGPVSGIVSIPRDLGARSQLRARLQRLHLAGGGGGERELGGIDPRLLPGLALDVDDFSVGARRFGRLTADIEAEPDGLRMSSLVTEAQSFVVEATGGWVDGPRGAETRLAFNLRSDDVGASLAELGFARFAEGQNAELTADVRWPGPPSNDWSRHVSGRAALSVATGSLLELEPGAGRVMGLMSITALPRRLALDFRDVFNRGLVFDQITGDFAIADGNAYTDNLKLTGPVAEIGVAGRTGLRDRDHRQQAVVTAEPGRMLPTVGGLLGGPGVGAALLIFTQIFKEPLKGIGRASYCVTGSWDEPAVERLSAEQLQNGRLCADLPVEGLSLAEQ
jgi:uncharacterized protein (TIGR02099 family)